MTILERSQKLHHVGIVMPDMQSAQDYMAIFDHQEDYRGYVDPFQCWCIFLTAKPDGTAIELVVPEGGPLASFNKGAGGLHHYALETPDIRAVQQELAARDVVMLEDEPVKGAGPFLCNFVHPVSTRGVIVEYIQLI